MGEKVRGRRIMVYLIVEGKLFRSREWLLKEDMEMKTPSEWHGVTYSKPLRPKPSKVGGIETRNTINRQPPPDVKNTVSFEEVRKKSAEIPKEKITDKIKEDAAKNTVPEDFRNFSASG